VAGFEDHVIPRTRSRARSIGEWLGPLAGVRCHRPLTKSLQSLKLTNVPCSLTTKHSEKHGTYASPWAEPLERPNIISSACYCFLPAWKHTVELPMDPLDPPTSNVCQDFTGGPDTNPGRKVLWIPHSDARTPRHMPRYKDQGRWGLEQFTTTF